MFVSEYLEIGDKLNSLGVFDSIIEKDSHFFINIIRLKQSSTPEFVSAYQRLNEYFQEIATLLDAAEQPNMADKMFREAKKRFSFSEVNGIGLGFAQSSYGAGFGERLATGTLEDAFQIIKKGSRQPEIFHLVSLFEANVGPDRLSDMVASIIKPNIEQYTLRMLSELGVNESTRPNLTFLRSGLIKNPYKNCALLLLPVEVLHELPIAHSWDDIPRVASENEFIRREIGEEISAIWSKWASAAQKDAIKRAIFLVPEACQRVIEGYRNESLAAFNPLEDPSYFAEAIVGKMQQSLSFKASAQSPISSFEGTMEVLGLFREWVENNNGSELIREYQGKKREKMVQRVIHLAAKHYVKVNDLDISFESNNGRGSLDVKLSRGNDRTITEIKLSTNNDYMNGYEAQLAEYGKAENTANLIYVFIDLGNPGRKNKLYCKHQQDVESGASCPELVIIDATEKKSASLFSCDDS